MRKHFLYLSNDHLIAVVWDGTNALSERAFTPDPDGLASFSEYAQRYAHLPTYLLTDLIEEDFRVEALPHVGARDRQRLLERKLLQLYRSTPYRLAKTVGRLADGRRDDQVLFCGLTNVDSIRIWVDILVESRTPLIGIYSVALLTEPLLKSLQLKAKHILWVSLQANAGWRQTYAQDGFVRFSRLTPTSGWQSPEALLFDQIEKTQRYLESIGSFSETEVLEVHVLCEQARQVNLRNALRDGGQLRFVFHDVSTVEKRLDAAITNGENEATPLYLRLLGRHVGGAQFAPPEQRRYAYLRQLRTTMLAASVAIAVLGASWAAWNVLQAQRLRAGVERLNQGTQTFVRQREQTVAAFPRSKVNAQTMNDAVTYHDKVVAKAPEFTQFALELSHVLNEFPNVRLDRLVWGADTRRNVDLNYQSSFSQTSAAPQKFAGADDATPGSYFQAAVVEAAIAPFNGNYRAALNEIERLQQRLKRLRGTQVAALALPLDTRAENNLKGSATPEKTLKEARFALQLHISPASAQ